MANLVELYTQVLSGVNFSIINHNLGQEYPGAFHLVTENGFENHLIASVNPLSSDPTSKIEVFFKESVTGTFKIVRTQIDESDKGPPRIQSTKTSNTQDINKTPSTSITFNENISSSRGIIHSSGSANFTITTAGSYKVSFKISYSGDNIRKNICCSVFVNGVEKLETRSYSYTRNKADGLGTCSLSLFEIVLNENDIVTIRGFRTGSGGKANTLLNQCWVRIEQSL